jgi:hypothetical protein
MAGRATGVREKPNWLRFVKKVARPCGCFSVEDLIHWIYNEVGEMKAPI